MNTATSAHWESLIDIYCQAWSQPNPDRRLELLDAVWAVHGSYTDPTVHAEGVAALAAHIATVQARRPGASVERTSGLDSHHRVARFAWQALDADGRVLREGIDLVDFNDEGKIARIVGFFGALAPR